MSYLGHKYIVKPDGSSKESWEGFACAHCGNKVSGAVVAYHNRSDQKTVKWLLCPNCGDGSVLTADSIVYPASVFGPQLEGLPDTIADAYEEARRCLSVNATTACELICRKILMHVAVEKGAKEGESFASYLSFLESGGYVTPPMKQWVDLIRQHGNKATHRLETPDRNRGESTLMLTAELLRLIYEMEYMAQKYIPNP